MADKAMKVAVKACEKAMVNGIKSPPLLKSAAMGLGKIAPASVVHIPVEA